MGHDLYFDDFAVGDVFETVPETVPEREIVAFAQRYDPQAFHTDTSQPGGVIASGFHTIALAFGQFFRLDLWANAILPSPGIDAIRWLAPVRPGDRLHTVNEVTEVKPSRSNPDRGLVRILHSAVNQQGTVVMTVDCMHRLRRRPR